MISKNSLCFLALFTVICFQVSGQEIEDSSDFEEILVYSTRGVNPSGARYHIDGCRYLKNGQFKIDERRAVERGLMPCSVCLPDRYKYLPFLKTKKETPKKQAFRKCVYKTKSGSKCSRAASEDNRYCELHESRGKPKK